MLKRHKSETVSWYYIDLGLWRVAMSIPMNLGPIPWYHLERFVYFYRGCRAWQLRVLWWYIGRREPMTECLPPGWLECESDEWDDEDWYQ